MKLKYIANVYRDTYQDEKSVFSSNNYDEVTNWINQTKDSEYTKATIWEWSYDAFAGGMCYNFKERI